MESDPAHIPFYIAASTVVMTAVISFAASIRGGKAPAVPRAGLIAFLISAIGILFAKYGANFGLPWQIYYSIPMLATVFVPPLIFRFDLARATAYIIAAFLSAPLIHAAFFYGLEWADYMPFMKLPR